MKRIDPPDAPTSAGAGNGEGTTRRDCLLGAAALAASASAGLAAAAPAAVPAAAPTAAATMQPGPQFRVVYLDK